MPDKALILGGYGAAGRAIARRLKPPESGLGLAVRARLVRVRTAPLAAALCLLVGCAGVWPSTAPKGPQPPRLEIAKRDDEQAVKKARSQQELRLRVQRFADEFNDGVNEPLLHILDTDPDVRRRRLALDMAYVYGSTAIQIAASPFPEVAVLDMVVFVSLTRDTIERWGVEHLGPSHRAALLARFRTYEEEIWSVARTLLDSEQEQTLRELLVEWRANNPDQKHVESIRFGEFIDELGVEDRAQARGLMSSVTNAAAAADDALELAERLTYFFQRAPLIWRLHAQIAFFDIITQPEMQSLVENSDLIASSADRMSRNLEALSSILIEGPQTPEQVALFENIEAGEQRIRSLMGDLRGTMQEASQLAQTVDALAVRFDLGGPPSPDAEPFDIAEYESVAAQVGTTSEELTELVQSLNLLLSSRAVQERLPLAMDDAQATSRELVRYVAVLALVVFFAVMVGTVCALLGYRYLAARLDSRLGRRDA